MVTTTRRQIPLLGTPGLAVVTVSALLCAVASIASALIGPASLRSGALVIGVVAALLVMVFWWFSASMIDAGARAMESQTRRGEFLAASARSYPILIAYPLLTLTQTALTAAGAPDIATAIGWLAIPLVGWFIIVTAVVIARVYEFEAFNAAALVMLPYAVVTLLLLVLILVVSALHAMGII